MVWRSGDVVIELLPCALRRASALRETRQRTRPHPRGRRWQSQPTRSKRAHRVRREAAEFNGRLRHWRTHVCRGRAAVRRRQPGRVRCALVRTGPAARVGGTARAPRLRTQRGCAPRLLGPPRPRMGRATTRHPSTLWAEGRTQHGPIRREVLEFLFTSTELAKSADSTCPD